MRRRSAQLVERFVLAPLGLLPTKGKCMDNIAKHCGGSKAPSAKHVEACSPIGGSFVGTTREDL
eukprot:1614681-Prorocentrum_lima.AAC.1